jgi:hypothetical protein
LRKSSSIKLISNYSIRGNIASNIANKEQKLESNIKHSMQNTKAINEVQQYNAKQANSDNLLVVNNSATRINQMINTPT